MEFVALFKIPTVTALPSPGDAGKLVRLSTDGNFYYDDGSQWRRIDEPGTIFAMTMKATLP